MAIKVRAKTLGWFGLQRRRPGDEFEVETEAELGQWMERLDGEPIPKRQPKLVDPLNPPKPVVDPSKPKRP